MPAALICIALNISVGIILLMSSFSGRLIPPTFGAMHPGTSGGSTMPMRNDKGFTERQIPEATIISILPTVAAQREVLKKMRQDVDILKNKRESLHELGLSALHELAKEPEAPVSVLYSDAFSKSLELLYSEEFINLYLALSKLRSDLGRVMAGMPANGFDQGVIDALHSLPGFVKHSGNISRKVQASKQTEEFMFDLENELRHRISAFERTYYTRTNGTVTIPEETLASSRDSAAILRIHAYLFEAVSKYLEQCNSMLDSKERFLNLADQARPNPEAQSNLKP